MLRTCGIEFARRAFFVVAPIAKPTKTSPIQSRSEVASRRTMPKAVLGPDRRSNARATRTPGRATTSPLTERPTAYEAGDTFDATSMSWNRNHCLLKYTLCEANRPVKEKVRTIAPMRDCIADAVSANTKMKITGRNENRLMTTRSIGSRRSGKASKRPMYSASRILDFNRSPHDLDERLFEARRFEGHLAFLAEPALDDREDLLGGLRLEDLGRGGAVRLVDRPEEDRAPLVHDQQMVREDLRLVEVVRRQEDGRAFPRELPHHVPDGAPTERIEADRRLVQEQDLRVRHHRHRDDQPLAEAAGQVGRELVAVLPESEVLHDFLGPFAGLRPRLAADQAEVEDVIVGGEEHLRPGFLRHDRDVRPDRLRVREHVVTQDGGAAKRGLELR